MAPIKLLVVEDDIASLELMSEVFSSLKAEVHAFSDSQEAAPLVDHEKFDGIFLDLEMPKVDGLQLAHRARGSSRNKSTPIVIVTGREQQDTMRESFATGATFFLQKPIDREKLIRLFRTVRGPMVQSHRRYTRVPLHTDVTCSLGSRTLCGRTWNLSLAGIQVEVDSLPAHETIKLSLKLPNSPIQIDAFGQVAWAKDGRQEIQFTKMSLQNKQQIETFIEQAESSFT
jgi:CheY-like chemotaxis protein